MGAKVLNSYISFSFLFSSMGYQLNRPHLRREVSFKIRIRHDEQHVLSSPTKTLNQLIFLCVIHLIFRWKQNVMQWQQDARGKKK